MAIFGFGEQEQAERIDNWGKFSEYGIEIFIAEQRATNALNDPTHGSKQVLPGSRGIITRVFVVTSKSFNLK